jgi:hypothetical protein
VGGVCIAFSIADTGADTDAESDNGGRGENGDIIVPEEYRLQRDLAR